MQGTNQYSFTKVLCSSEKHNPKNQTELAESYGITQQTMNNYMRMASMIPELFLLLLLFDAKYIFLNLP